MDYVEVGGFSPLPCPYAGSALFDLLFFIILLCFLFLFLALSRE